MIAPLSIFSTYFLSFLLYNFLNIYICHRLRLDMDKNDRMIRKLLKSQDNFKQEKDKNALRYASVVEENQSLTSTIAKLQQNIEAANIKEKQLQADIEQQKQEITKLNAKCNCVIS